MNPYPPEISIITIIGAERNTQIIVREIDRKQKSEQSLPSRKNRKL